MGKQNKILLLGDFAVGKSSLVAQYVHSKFTLEYLSTIGVHISKKSCHVNGEEVKLLIWDIAGRRDMQTTPDAYYMGASGALFVFDLTREETYSHLSVRLNSVRKSMSKDNILVLGNKRDLCSDADIDLIQSRIDTPVDFLTSAKTGENVQEAFETLAQRANQPKPRL